MSKKLTKEQQLYIDKQLEFAEELYNKADEQLQELYKQQKNNRDNILNEIAKIMLSYTITDGTMSLNSVEKKNVYSKLSKLVNEKLQFELNNETFLTKDILNFVGKEKYNTNNYLYNLGMDYNLKPVKNDTLEKIINAKVEEKTWSDRLWTNKNEIATDLKKEINNFLNGKTSVNEIESKIKKKYNSNSYNTKRLIQDNICRVQEGINNVWQQEHNIKYVLYMATLDGHICANCAQYDGKSFERDKKPVSIPQHPFCRCCYTSIPNSEWRPKERIDNETKEEINWQSYKEWEKEYIKSTGAIGKIHKNDYKRKQRHADTYYESIRKRNDDVINISKNTGINKNTIQKVKEHVFINKYHLAQGYTNFYPDYEMSIAWQRLIEGRNIKKSDIVLLHHERLECYLMNRYNYTYEDAHRITCKKYNYAKALKEE